MSVIDDRYAQLGAVDGFLGSAVSDEQPTSDGKARYRIYEHGAIYWLVYDPDGSGLSTKTYEVHGAIWEKYRALGREDVYGLPLSDETAGHDGVGRFNVFQGGGGIYWTPTIGANEVHGAINVKYQSLSAEQGPLGYPTTDETACQDGHGRFNHFQGGSIYWTPEIDSHEVHGAIHEKWSDLGSERSLLGYPVSDEMPDSYATGKLNRFQHGLVYWFPQTGAHEVHGAILEEWLSLGAERSYLGRPTTDEHLWLSEKLNTGGQRNIFEHGQIAWIPGKGAAPWPNSYTFTVTRMMVLNTRSRHEDTDRVSASVAVGNGPAKTVTQDVGDVNNGNYNIDLTVGPVTVGSNEDGVAFNYLILNAGNAEWDDVNRMLHQAGDKLAELGAKAATDAAGSAVGATIGTAVLPVIGSIVGAIAGWISGELVGLLTANCDGPVGAEQAAFRGQDLWDQTSVGPHEFSTVHDGTDSPAGCGSNSLYWVDWRLARA